jgi:pimeloyl-ACP methyl ester carboxylesterase
MKLRRMAVSACLLAALGCLVWLGARRHRDRFHYYVSGPDPALAKLAADSGYAPHALTTAQGVQLQLLLRPPPAESDPLLVLFPGNVDHQLRTGVPLLERLRAGRSAGGLVVSYRGFDGSTGTPGPRAAAHDARAVLDYVDRELGVHAERVLLVGYSMGSGIALRAAAELAQRGRPPGLLLLLSPFYELELEPAGLLGPILPSETYTVQEVIPYLRSRTLVVAAGADSALPVAQHARPLSAALGQRATYLELPGAEHADYLQDAQVFERLAPLVWQGF